MENVSINYVDNNPNSITYVKQITLDSLGIKNDGTSPLETSAGLNQAVQYAREQGFNNITLPKGTYLIHETNPILIDFSNIVIDLNGSTLQLNANANENYLIKIKAGVDNVRIINGTIAGNILVSN